MTEKADLPSDQVSLPPNYAPSETYTESPPPAYRQPGRAAVRVARIVCFTLLAMTFIVGFFVVTHKWVQNRECHCPNENSRLAEHAALFAQAPKALNSELNNNKIEEDIEQKEEPLKKAEEEEDLVSSKQVEENENSDEENRLSEDDAEEEVEEVNNDVHLPKDLLLGNPMMAGKNVHCKVEKKQRKIAEGIMAQAIIVTCDDDESEGSDETEENRPLPMPLLPIRPPMSLLSSIMKVLSSRPRSVVDEQREEPRILPFPPRHLQGPLPMLQPIRGPFPGGLPAPFPGSFPGPVSPVFVPLRKIEIRRPFPQQEDEETNAFPVPFQQEPPRLIRNEDRSPRMHMVPRPPLPFIQPPEEGNIQRLPFPMPSRPLPIRVIRLPQPEEENEEETSQNNFPEPDNEGPFPLHPMIRLLPTRRRIIRLRPKQSLDNSQREPIPFPFPRGALPPHSHSDEPPMPHPMPEASGRALPSPVALPGVRVLRLPFRPQPQTFPEAKVITHMEVRERPEELQEPSPLQPPNFQNRRFPNNKEFGPPKTHTVIENSPRSIADEQQPEGSTEPFHEEPITQTQSQPRFVAPPPPRFAREGRTSLMARLNPDAEVIPTNWDEEPNSPDSSIHRIVLN